MRRKKPAKKGRGKKPLQRAALAAKVVWARSRLGVRSQTVIPRKVREALGLRPGDEIVFEIGDGSAVLRKAMYDSENPVATFGEWSSPADAKGYEGF